jgi:hypothetical protein
MFWTEPRELVGQKSGGKPQHSRVAGSHDNLECGSLLPLSGSEVMFWTEPRELVGQKSGGKPPHSRVSDRGANQAATQARSVAA